MTKFTNILPPEDPFGADASYIVIHAERGEIWAPQSARQILSERYGWAARGGYVWAKLDPTMAAAILQPAPVATDDGERERLRSSIRTAMNRIDAASGLLDSAFEDLTDGLLEGKDAS